MKNPHIDKTAVLDKKKQKGLKKDDEVLEDRQLDDAESVASKTVPEDLGEELSDAAMSSDLSALAGEEGAGITSASSA